MSALSEASGMLWDAVEIEVSAGPRPGKKKPTRDVPAWAWVLAAVSIYAGAGMLVLAAWQVVSASAG